MNVYLILTKIPVLTTQQSKLNIGSECAPAFGSSWYDQDGTQACPQNLKTPDRCLLFQEHSVHNICDMCYWPHLSWPWMKWIHPFNPAREETSPGLVEIQQILFLLSTCIMSSSVYQKEPSNKSDCCLHLYTVPGMQAIRSLLPRHWCQHQMVHGYRR